MFSLVFVSSETDVEGVVDGVSTQQGAVCGLIRKLAFTHGLWLELQDFETELVRKR